MRSSHRVLRNLTFANQLTFLRLVSIPFFVMALLANRHTLALGLFAFAAVTDSLDGLIARILKQKTALGAILDPAADKLLLTTAVIMLTMPDHLRISPDFTLANRVPLWLTLLALSRDVFIVLTAGVLYLVYGRTSFPPTRLGKLTTFSLVILVSVVLLYNSLEVPSNVVVPLLVWAALALILMSGFHYIYRTAILVRETQPDSATEGLAGEQAGGSGQDRVAAGETRSDLKLVRDGRSEGSGQA